MGKIEFAKVCPSVRLPSFALALSCSFIAAALSVPWIKGTGKPGTIVSSNIPRTLSHSLAVNESLPLMNAFKRS